MGLFEHFPYSNFHELNLDWILDTLKQLDESVTKFISINSIKYANPIQWDITSQYEKNTVVLDKHGNAYLSVQPVPAGISLDRTEYWTVIGNFSELWASVKAAITPNDEGHDETASANRAVGDWVWVNDTLYIITKAMTAGDKYVDGSNCQNTNIMNLYNNLRTSLDTATLNLQGQITNEATTRQNADNILQENINSEATERENADTILQENITKEATERKNADEQLATDIAKSGTFLNFKAFGAIGDGVADDTEAIKSCIAAAENSSVGISGNFGKYKVSNTITIDGTKISFCHVEGTIYPTFTDKPCVVINDAFNGNYEFHVWGPDFNGGYQFGNWSNYNQLELPMKGIVVNHCQQSQFLLTARMCNTGISIENAAESDGTGCAYNTFNIPNCGDNAVSIDLMAKDNGWVNENLFLGVSVHDYSQNPNASKVIGIRLWTNNSTHKCNNNVFVKPCLQCRGLPIVINGGNYNSFRDVRCESAGKPASVPFYVRCNITDRENVFMPLYGNDTNYYESPSMLACNYAAPSAIGNSAYRTPIALWNFNPNKAKVANSVLSVEDFDTYYPGMNIETPTYLPGTVSENGVSPSNGSAIGRFINLTSSPVICLVANGNNIRQWVTLFDSEMTPINATVSDIVSLNYTVNNTTMRALTINGISVLADQNNQDNNICINAITNTNAKYAFYGVSGVNISFIEMFALQVSSGQKILSNVMPKKTPNPN